jgi:hypothetical protein
VAAPPLWPRPTGQPRAPLFAWQRRRLRRPAGGCCRPLELSTTTSTPTPFFSCPHVDADPGPPRFLCSPPRHLKRVPLDAVAPHFPFIHSPFEPHHNTPPLPLGLSSAPVAMPPPLPGPPSSPISPLHNELAPSCFSSSARCSFAYLFSDLAPGAPRGHCRSPEPTRHRRPPPCRRP